MAASHSIETLNRLFSAEAIALRRDVLFDRVPPEVPAGIGLQDKARGLLLGLAIGDALGNTSEGRSTRARDARHGEIRDYLPNRHAGGRRVGLPSDDTQLAFCTLEQALEDGGLDRERPAEALRRPPHLRHRGHGQPVLANHRAGRPWYQCGPPSAGNGALMRIAPVLVPYLAKPSPALWADTALAAMLTHNGGASNSACLAFVAMLWDLLAMATPPAPEWWLEQYLRTARDLEPATPYRPREGAYTDFHGTLCDYLERVIPPARKAGLPVAEAGNGWYSGAFLLETVPSVLYILMSHGHDPEEAIVRTVNDTRDNDTIAAIVGAAVGALHGAFALPGRWLDGLLGRTRADDDGRVYHLLSEAMERWLQPRKEPGDAKSAITPERGPRWESP